ncbi:MAG: hypothetical protein JRJ85_04170 [Deltaproteobacteria bacterium]|nr:hypothetical protein [Deltaproteobacteria bacterium]
MCHRQPSIFAKKWLGDDASTWGYGALQLTVKEQAWLRKHPVIRVALDPDGAPVQFKDEIGKLHLNTIRVTGETPYAYNQCMAVRDDWPELAGILQKALDAISQYERNSIYNNWMSLKYEHAFDYSLFWKIAIGAGPIVMKKMAKTIREVLDKKPWFTG